MKVKDQGSEKLEQLWAGDFGRDYIARNIKAAEGREPFWNWFFKSYEVGSTLEVGCNIGGNLTWILKRLPARQIYAVDINEEAVKYVQQNFTGINTVCSPAKVLPFRDNFFDLVFTTGVLIHQSPETLLTVMSEIVRCSRKYVLCGEYFSEKLVEVPYRGQEGALFKQDYGALYQKNFPNLKLLEKKFHSKADGWDDITFWLFEKKGNS